MQDINDRAVTLTYSQRMSILLALVSDMEKIAELAAMEKDNGNNKGFIYFLRRRDNIISTCIAVLGKYSRTEIALAEIWDKAVGKSHCKRS